MKKYIVIILILNSLNLSAQFFPTLELSSISENARIHNLYINIEVTGNIALTTIEMLFYNPNDSIMEGTLNFPLTPNQEIIDFQLEVNGKMRKASVVEKNKARVAYEGTIRQNIDPGLLEKKADNSYSARIFPIPRKGYKRVIISIQEELKLTNNYYSYILPLKSEYIIPSFKLNGTLFSESKPTTNSGLDFFNFENSYSLDFEKKDYKLDKQIKINIPKNNTPVWVQDNYFYATVDISDLYLLQKSNIDKSLENLTILWDISSSAEKRDLESEYSYLTNYLKSINKDCNITIQTFNIFKYPKVTFKSEQINEILSYLKNLKYDGGSIFNNLELGNIYSDKILLFSDGISTFEKYNQIDKFNTPIDTICSSYTANTSLLKYYSIKSGGNYINLLSGISNYAQPKLLNINGIGVDQLYNDVLLDGNQFSVSGKLLNKDSKVHLLFEKADGSRITKNIIINGDTKTTNIDLKRIWAQKKIEDLDLLYDENREEITALGKEFGIVTRNSSLLVLDRVEDYITYNITPPEELKNKWDSLKEIEVVNNKKIHEENILESLNAISSLKSWWLKDFPKNRPPIDNKIKKESISEDESEAPLMMLQESSSELNPSNEVFGMQELKKSTSTNNTSTISIDAWTPDVPYYKDLSDLNNKELLTKYYEIRSFYKNRPSFFVDVATLFYDKNDSEHALLIISNIVEMELEEPELLRITMYLLEKFGYYKEALNISFNILEIRPEEPQSYRDIASLSLLNNKYQQSLDFYYKVLTGSWDSRFNGVKSVVLNEMNYLINKHSSDLNLKDIDSRLIFNMPVGVRAVISWSSDNNDIDLWVKDPYLEDCGYSNPLTYTGGKLSSDFTGGYGPEEFTIKNPLFGKYSVDINFYSDNRVSVSGPVTIKVDLYTNYGLEVERKTIIRRLVDVKDRITIGTLDFK